MTDTRLYKENPENEDKQSVSKAKKTRKVGKYLAVEPVLDVDVKGIVKPLEGWTRSSRMADVEKFLEVNKVKILDRFGLDEVQIAVFPEPIIKTIKRETKVSVT